MLKILNLGILESAPNTFIFNEAQCPPTPHKERVNYPHLDI